MVALLSPYRTRPLSIESDRDDDMAAYPVCDHGLLRKGQQIGA